MHGRERCCVVLCCVVLCCAVILVLGGREIPHDVDSCMLTVRCKKEGIFVKEQR
jgi:hypothetical protein